jgi:hypothetical protein
MWRLLPTQLKCWTSLKVWTLCWKWSTMFWTWTSYAKIERTYTYRSYSCSYFWWEFKTQFIISTWSWDCGYVNLKSPVWQHMQKIKVNGCRQYVTIAKSNLVQMLLMEHNSPYWEFYKKTSFYKSLSKDYCS